MNVNDIPENMMNKLRYYLSDLGNLNLNGYNIKNINFCDKEIIFCTTNSSDEYKINFENIENKQRMVEESTSDENIDLTSDMNTEQLKKTDDFSSTSVNENSEKKLMPKNNEVENQGNQMGGNNKNIFKSSKYSDTSSNKFNELTNYSKTSSVIYNDRSDNFSETSVIGQIGGGLETSDTLRSVSELKERKNKSSAKTSSHTSTFKSNLDIGIFKKSQNQSGGFKSSLDLKKKMLEAGINSSSTSSICE